MPTLDDLVLAHANARPDALALIDVIDTDAPESRVDTSQGVLRLTWADLADAVDRVAGVLLGQGLRDGELITTVLPIGADSIVTQLAVLRIAATLLDLDPDDPGDTTVPGAAVITTTHALDRWSTRGAAALRAANRDLRLVLVWGPGPRDTAVWLDPAVAAGRDRDLVARHRRGHATGPDTVLGPAAGNATHELTRAAGARIAAAHGLSWGDVLLDAAPTRATFLGQAGAAWLASGCTLAVAGSVRAPALWELAVRCDATVVLAPASALVPAPVDALFPVRQVIATAPGDLAELGAWGSAAKVRVTRWGQPGLAG